RMLPGGGAGLMSRLVPLLSLFALGVGLLWTGPAAGQQPPRLAPPDGTEALRAILKQKFKLEPLPSRDFNPPDVLVVVLGKPPTPDVLPLEKLKPFVHSGAALLVATDYNTTNFLESFGLQVSGDFLVVPRDSRSAYGGRGECPLIQAEQFERPQHPIFHN